MVGKQAQAFLLGEGDSWFERNKDKPRENDPVLQAIGWLGIIPKRVWEIGCGTGWRLDRLAEKYNCLCFGVDPSEKALGIDNPGGSIRREKVLLLRGTAIGSYFADMDLILLSFCLYVVDREDLFRVVCETDRALVDEGYIIIHDFYSPHPFSRVYEHNPELRSYHMDHSKLWLGHPHYHLVGTYIAADETCVAVLQKNTGGAFPLE